jgi:hypothetical protein
MRVLSGKAETSRRSFLAGSAALPGAAVARAQPAADLEQVRADLETYIGFGNKQSGGRGDQACGEWMAGELARNGFAVERQAFTAPFFEPTRCELTAERTTATVWAQPIVIPTGPNGVSGRLMRVEPNGPASEAGALSGAIALLNLPHARHSSAAAKPIHEAVNRVFAAGARAAVVVTNGPTGKLIALNADGRQPMFDRPVALLAPDSAAPFLSAADRRGAATLVLDGRSGRRPAFNFIGRLDRKQPRWIVVSTPRSGWFTCAGERGGGVATWLWLARWASRAPTSYNFAFLCNSGHEYEYLGAAEALKVLPPKPADTHFWLHLGANVASRDWHELTMPWRPLPSIDPQRYLSVSPALVDAVKRVFEGHVGYEAPYSTDQLAAGELVEIARAGYTNAAGVFGTHRFHHVADDDLRCVSSASVAATANAFQRFVQLVSSPAS